ncbi:cytochrome ubiquinol oxidase subunit I [Allonocardiopsis opalescens]|uniref:Cytochrome bd-I ubiquinol oxidase subunit 1 apoprotein n=1 Tax=Allonocardiopsis opalescens TaxID=1144618 RepID=A0A2T0PVW0_9ACTN|nr:cytochrome ubiquinol oxidase subunit I [Allonocardiopsis opalescens]PRX95647.1 cytochrome bd-I ubiquinol oxidase subunit 1 apoprotein [Allonocardiopsis opalescens]
MDALDLARWQFGITTVYHFVFVPLTIGLSVIVAGFQTAWHRTGDPVYLRLTRFFGKLFLINFAMGVVTGIVQEFQFGMNWSEYSRFVGDVFGAPLALEALVAFFLESTFIGLWIFGWDRLPRRAHLAAIWLAAIGSNLSAYFILAANAWMRHPVGYRIDPETGRAQLTDIWAVLTNPTALATVPHVLAGSFLAAGGFVIAVCGYHLLKNRTGPDTRLFRTGLRAALAVTALAGAVSAVSGHTQAQLMHELAPMKLAAAEALWETESGAGFSVFAVPDPENERNVVSVQIPYALSFLATNDPNAEVQGLNDLQAAYEQEFGPGEYRPNVPVIFWSFRFMMAFGMSVAALAVLGLWLTRRGGLPAGPWFYRAALLALPLPFLANIFGWIMTEMGRQPWTVFGVLQTAASVSPGVSTATVAITLLTFTVLYGVLFVVEARLLARYIAAGPPPDPAREGTRPSGAPDGERTTGTAAPIDAEPQYTL